MPSIRIPGPFKVSFYSADCAERMHVHVKFQGAVCKIWLNPIEVHDPGRFKDYQLAKIMKLVEKNEKLIKEKWNEHCEKEPKKKK